MLLSLRCVCVLVNMVHICTSPIFHYMESNYVNQLLVIVNEVSWNHPLPFLGILATF